MLKFRFQETNFVTAVWLEMNPSSENKNILSLWIYAVIWVEICLNAEL